MALPAHRVIGHKEWGNTPPGGYPGRKTDPTYSMAARRDQVANFTPRNDLGGFLMALSDAEQRELLDRIRLASDQLGGDLWAHPDVKQKRWGWPNWRFGPDRGERMTLLDFIRSIDQQLNSRTDFQGHVAPDADVNFGHVLSLRQQVAELHDKLDKLVDHLGAPDPR